MREAVEPQLARGYISEMEFTVREARDVAEFRVARILELRRACVKDDDPDAVHMLRYASVLRTAANDLDILQKNLQSQRHMAAGEDE